MDHALAVGRLERRGNLQANVVIALLQSPLSALHVFGVQPSWSDKRQQHRAARKLRGDEVLKIFTGRNRQIHEHVVRDASAPKIFEEPAGVGRCIFAPIADEYACHLCNLAVSARAGGAACGACAAGAGRSTCDARTAATGCASRSGCVAVAVSSIVRGVLARATGKRKSEKKDSKTKSKKTMTTTKKNQRKKEVKKVVVRLFQLHR